MKKVRGLAVAVAITSVLVSAPVGGGAAGAATDVPPPGTITGVVTDDATGAALAGMCVGAYDENVGTLAVSPATGPDGRYSVAVPEGAYEVAFQDCRAVPLYRDELHRDRPVGFFWTPAGERVWVAAGTTVVVDAALALGAAITGTLTGVHTGRPYGGCVGAYRAVPPDHWTREVLGDWPEWMACTGRPDPLWFGDPVHDGTPGAFVLGGLPPGDYVLSFGSFLDPAGDGWYGGSSRDSAAVVRLAAGQRGTVAAGVAPRPGLPMECLWGAVPPISLRFDDVPDDRAHAGAIGCLLHLGLIQGVGPHHFAPDAPLTRGQAATITAGALRAQGWEPPTAPPDAFDDDAGSPHETAIDQLAAAGVVAGSGGRRFAPNAMVSRGQLATMVVAAYQVATGWSLRSAGDRFDDDDGSVHEPAIDRAAAAGLVHGTADGSYRPAAALTRAQAATAFSRWLGLVEMDLGGVG